MPRGPAAPPRVGVIYERGGTWNQVGPALAAGFRGHGAEVTLIGAEVGLPVLRLANVISRVHRLDLNHGPLLGVRNVRARVALSRARAVDFWVQVGSTLPDLAPARYVTFEDMTVNLALEGFFEQSIGDRARRAWLARQQRAYAGAGRCYVASDWAADSILAGGGVPAEKVSVVGIGHNLTIPEVAPARDWQRPSFLWVGREWRRKNGDAVIRAFTRIHDEQPDAVLHLVGDHPDRLGEGIVGHGPLSRADAAQTAELTRLFRSTTCFVMPSYLEPWGIVYVEAATCGTATIGTTRGGAATAIGDGGICVDPADGTQLLTAMRRMCDPAIAQAYGEAGRRHSTQFTWSHITGQIMADAGYSSEVCGGSEGS